jgi:hypothetical protein
METSLLLRLVWRISKEKFMEELNFVNLKAVSWGITGNDRIKKCLGTNL